MGEHQERMDRLGCSLEEAQYLTLLESVINHDFLPYQEATILELRRAHKDGRRPNLFPKHYRRKQ